MSRTIYVAQYPCGCLRAAIISTCDDVAARVFEWLDDGCTIRALSYAEYDAMKRTFISACPHEQARAALARARGEE